MSVNVYQMVTDRIIAQMEKGIVPWQQPWHGFKNANPEECAIGYESRTAYSFLNQWLLGKPGEYLTFKQIQKHGGRIKKGEKSSIVVFYQPLKIEDKDHVDENGKPKMRVVPFLKYYNVWNINQCEGIESIKPKEDDGPKMKPEEKAEEIVNGYMGSDNHPSLRIVRSDRAYYRPSTDEVVVPAMQQYDDIAEFYSTLFHELTHSTGHRSRCNRKGVADMLNRNHDEYSKEELVAEMGAAMLVSFAGIPADRALDNSAAYIQGWLRHLKDDPKLVVWASSLAEKAVKWILGENDKEREESCD